ncbi:hypothetical protein B0H10DRAFT_1940651 [Mycena sp. CBHHK59/15]|nr:hypothetical protein B0H10DRAFT_1940651 [Mycena sp. CBHHK59/15]
MTLPFFHRVIAAPRNSSPIPMVGACRTCKVTKGREDVKTCQTCHRANYCSVKCQRADWPEHKLTCKGAVDGNVTIRIGRRLSDDLYFQVHLLLYAIRCLGLPELPTGKHDFFLIVIVDMVPLSPTENPPQQHRKCTIVKNIIPVPACIVPEEVLDTQCAVLAAYSNKSPVHSLWIATTGVYPEGEESSVESSVLPWFQLRQFFHSYGVQRRVTPDLDFLFESMNDELRLEAPPAAPHKPDTRHFADALLSIKALTSLTIVASAAFSSVSGQCQQNTGYLGAYDASTGNFVGAVASTLGGAGIFTLDKSGNTSHYLSVLTFSNACDDGGPVFIQILSPTDPAAGYVSLIAGVNDCTTGSAPWAVIAASEGFPHASPGSCERWSISYPGNHQDDSPGLMRKSEEVSGSAPHLEIPIADSTFNRLLATPNVAAYSTANSGAAVQQVYLSVFI